MALTRSGTVALVGRSNVGKSTLLNAALDLPLAIVSRKPQTTRSRLLGVVRHNGAEIGLLDTPGLHAAGSRLGKEMNRAATSASREADVVCFVTALPPKLKGIPRPHPKDLELLEQLEGRKVILVVNKIDLLKDKKEMLPLLEALAKAGSPEAIVPISALTSDGIERLLDEVAKLLPEGPAHFEEDAITDRPLRYFAAEYVREPILTSTSEEVPHAVAVTVERFAERTDRRLVDVEATIHVERNGQKRILVGHKGEMVKRIGIRARERLEELIETPVNLQLFVRVTPDWREKPTLLRDFGLMGDHEEKAAIPAAALEEARVALAAVEAEFEDDD